MTSFAIIFEDVLHRAIAEAEAKAIPVFTFAFYHDHESEAVSVCIDTQANSVRMVAEINTYNMKHFMKAIGEGDLKTASLWEANIGRSLSLGDFIAINLARTELGGTQADAQFYVQMIQALVKVQDRIAALSPSPASLIFTCSGPSDEVEFAWALPASAG